MIRVWGTSPFWGPPIRMTAFSMLDSYIYIYIHMTKPKSYTNIVVDVGLESTGNVSWARGKHSSSFRKSLWCINVLTLLASTCNIKKEEEKNTRKICYLSNSKVINMTAVKPKDITQRQFRKCQRFKIKEVFKIKVILILTVLYK